MSSSRFIQSPLRSHIQLTFLLLFFFFQFLDILKVSLCSENQEAAPIPSCTSLHGAFFPLPPRQLARSMHPLMLVFMLRLDFYMCLKCGQRKKAKGKLKISEAKSGNPILQKSGSRLSWFYRGEHSTDNQQETELSRFRGVSG